MITIKAKSDYGEKETFEKWNGKFYDENDLDEIIRVTENTVVMRPDSTLDGSGVPIAYVVTDAFPDDHMRNILYEIEESSIMRANCSGPINKEEMAAKGLIEGGVQLGVSSRGMGSLVSKNGKNYVGEDFVLGTVDIVQDPSADNAYVNGIMEGASWIYDAAKSSWVKQEMIEDLVRGAKKGKINEDLLVKQFKDLLF